MKRVLWFGAALTVAGAVPLAAQATIGVDVAAFSSYVWRGITYTNKPVLQPDLWVSFPLGSASVTAGGWANIDIGKYNGSEDISESGGQSSFNLAEFDWWAELGYTVSKATLTAGITGYIFPNDFGFTSDYNTTEVYGKVLFAVPALNPKLAAWYDVDFIKGLYVEGSVSHSLPLGAKSLTLGAAAGWTGGQEVNTSDPNQGFNFAESGLTHVDLSASMALSAGSVSITPSIHGVFGIDDATQYAKPTTTFDTKFKVWGGVTLAWSHTGGSKEEKSE